MPAWMIRLLLIALLLTAGCRPPAPESPQEQPSHEQLPSEPQHSDPTPSPNTNSQTERVEAPPVEPVQAPVDEVLTPHERERRLTRSLRAVLWKARGKKRGALLKLALTEMGAEKTIEAAEIWARNGGFRGIELLLAALEEGDDQVVQASSKSLFKLTGEDHGTDTGAWQRWLQTIDTEECPGKGHRISFGNRTFQIERRTEPGVGSEECTVLRTYLGSKANRRLESTVFLDEQEMFGYRFALAESKAVPWFVLPSHGTFYLYRNRVKTNKISGPYRPSFPHCEDCGQDGQSGAITSLIRAKGGRFLVGSAVDLGLFVYDLRDPLKTEQLNFRAQYPNYSLDDDGILFFLFEYGESGNFMGIVAKFSLEI